MRREYLTRVKKKSFIVMTLLTPLILVAFYGALIWVTITQMESEKPQKILVADAGQILHGQLPDQGSTTFDIRAINKAEGLEFLLSEKPDGLLIIPPDFDLFSANRLEFITLKKSELKAEEAISRAVEKRIATLKMQQMQISKSLVDSLETKISLNTARYSAEKGASIMESSAVNLVVGFIGAFAIYFFIFAYGVSVMKGVQEEKQNRIVEVMITSTRPENLMLGKIMGVALVGLTQFAIWVILTLVLGSTLTMAFGMNMPAATPDVMGSDALEQAKGDGLMKIFEALLNLNYPIILGAFIFYFITGYLLYSALFAAIAAAVDSETDTQQFMLPITLPLVFALVVAQSAVIGNPGGSLAFWFSIFPLTSPVVMMVRIPFEVPAWELLLSMVLMVLGFIGTALLASKIYRTGILMYGKKVNYRELWKWIRHA